MKPALFLSVAIITLLSFTSNAQPANEVEVNDILLRHNYWRADVGVGELSYSDELAEAAFTWAEKLKEKGCAFEHSGNGFGENLFKGTKGYYTVEDAIDSWAGEKKDYNYSKNKCKSGAVCGHYTQLVWKNTTEVGCAQIECNGMVTWVCNYNPPGNYVGEKPY
ncbi:MAG: pathogenesis-related family 1 protein [Cyclobacteriaceae bacterium]